MSEEHDCNCPPPGSPAWMGTFADLMSLLMCFFVLLLSFSEMDAMKFKRLAGSLSLAFGVQNKIKVKDIPKGTSVIAQEFSPGRPEPTPINEIWQKTDTITKESLDVECAQEYDVEQGAEDSQSGIQAPAEQETEEGGQGEQNNKEMAEELQKLIKETEDDAVELAKALRLQIARGEVEIETRGRQIVVRIREKGSFASGSATLARDYIPVMQEMSAVLATQPGRILVQGHTDDVPISTAKFRSNWELSTARAVSVAHELFAGGGVEPKRVQVTGFADTKPIADNQTFDGRATNRRVEVVIHQGIDQNSKEKLQELKQKAPDLYKGIGLDPEKEFVVKPGEIF